MAIVALYPGTFDPFTNGHCDLVRRATKLFDKVYVAVGFQTLMVDFAKEIGATAIIRGLRAVSDFEYEVQLASMNRKLSPGIETVYLSPADEHAAVSSSLIKDIARHNGDISRFTHPIVNEALKVRVKQEKS